MMSSPVCGRVSWSGCRGAAVAGGSGGSARRCLFGSVDYEELQREYTLLMRAELEDAARRWSFDFITDRPRVGGDFEWVGLTEARVPFLYRDRTVGADLQTKGAGPASDLGEAGNTQCSEKHTLKRKQTNITDFYQAKRRVVTTRKSGQ